MNAPVNFSITPYEFVGDLLMLQGQPLDVKSYPYLKAILNTKCPEVGLFTARQVAKSTTLAMKLVMKAVTSPQSSQIYVAPLQDQAEVFSMQRLRDFIVDSPIVKNGFFSGNGVVDQVFRKIFSNRSIIA